MVVRSVAVGGILVHSSSDLTVRLARLQRYIGIADRGVEAEGSHCLCCCFRFGSRGVGLTFSVDRSDLIAIYFLGASITRI